MEGNNAGAHMLQMDPRATQKIAAATFAANYKSKREVYTFLAVDLKAYLPPYENLTIYFLRDLIRGAKKSKLQSIPANGVYRDPGREDQPLVGALLRLALSREDPDLPHGPRCLLVLHPRRAARAAEAAEAVDHQRCLDDRWATFRPVGQGVNRGEERQARLG
jgi:hypothetical protein